MVKQAEQLTVEAQSNARPDESIIVQLICTAWRRRGVILVAALVGVLIGIAVAANNLSKASAPVTSYIALSGMKIIQQDNNDGQTKQQLLSVSYPNGTAFVPQDLLDPQVLARVKEQLGLGDDVSLRYGIGVSFDSPKSEGVLRRYRDRLGARTVTAAEIDVLNLALERDLLSANLSGLRIDVSPSALGVSDTTAIAIAKALPQAWREIFTQRYGTLLNPDLPNLTASKDEGDLATPPGVVAAQMAIVSMLRGLELIGSDDRLAGVVNASGQTATDLGSGLRQFYTVEFAPFAAPVFASDSPSVLAYRKEVEMKIAAARRDAQSIDQTLQEILSSPVTKAGPQQTTDGTVQIDGTMLSQVLSLAQRASLTEMMPGMFERRQRIGADIARLENELVMASASGSVLPSTENVQTIAAGLQRIAEQYREIYALALERLRNTSSQFYSELTSPTVEAKTIGTRTLALFIGPIALALIVAIGYLVLSALFGRMFLRR